ncbi:MAG TPA: hypothetical protein VG759_17150, partial [Candidatus Angelobacter sp.]|nr:hypothetical protein [Candidatus Angelobacter sp.]
LVNPGDTIIWSGSHGESIENPHRYLLEPVSPGKPPIDPVIIVDSPGDPQIEPPGPIPPPPTRGRT